jgi:hypothetical protein
MADAELIECPYCGEQLEIVVDWSVARQEYIEDCHVCCKPMSLIVSVVICDDGSHEARVSARTGDD